MGLLSRFRRRQRPETDERVTGYFSKPTDPKQSEFAQKLHEIREVLDVLLEETHVIGYQFDALDTWFKLRLNVGAAQPLMVEGRMDRGVQAVGFLTACCGAFVGYTPAAGLTLSGSMRNRCGGCGEELPADRVYSITMNWDDNSYDGFVERIAEELPALFTDGGSIDPLTAIVLGEDVLPFIEFCQHLSKASLITAMLQELEAKDAVASNLAQDAQRLSR